ncbi:MAG: hypothetical protein HZB25_03000 [Candidatus Eisenbacteria bacterium]|nr:hypothetical protein [Candidatus Eisenbacteria bacterium]
MAARGARRTAARWLVMGTLALALLGVRATPGGASATIDVHFSVKVIRDPATGNRPPVDDTLQTNLLTDNMIASMFYTANEVLLKQYWRGYRFVLDEIVDVGWPCVSCPGTNPSMWYGATYDSPTMKDLENTAMANAVSFIWRPNQVNIYINMGKGDGAAASFPPPDLRSNHVVVAGARIFDPQYAATFPGAILVHEMGHYFSLPHPNGSIDTCCVASLCITDGDQIDDTLPDGPCFTLNQLSLFRYGQAFVLVNAAKQDSLLNVFWNNMAYMHIHDGQVFGQTLLDRMTELQLDRWADSARTIRRPVCSGRTFFVATDGNLFGSGTGVNPYLNVSTGIAACDPAGGDVVMIRPGNYHQNLTITKKVTLRATREGVVRIAF